MRRSTAAVALAALLLVGGCSGGGTAGVASPATAAAPAPSAATSAETPAATGGPAPTELAGVPVAAPDGYQVVALPPAVTEQLAGLAEAAGQQVAELESAGITDSAGNEAAVVIVSRYSGIDVTSAEFEDQRRAQAATRGSALRPETIAGESTLVSDTPALVSWTSGDDTLVVLSSGGQLGLDELRRVATAMLTA